MSGYTSLQALKEMGSSSFTDRTENPWAKFYGQPPYYSPDMLDPEARKLTVAPDLPVAYVGKNYFIPSLVEELVMTTDNWYTRVALPLKFTDQITWKMNVTTFDQRLPRNTPHKATSRILDSRQTSRNGKLERHGVMYEMEANFMDTPEGREHYAFTLNQMANGIVMLLNVGVIQAYLDADNYQREWEKAHGMKIASDVYLKIEREINMFAIVQKEKHGLRKLDAIVSEWMEAYQGTANMWIFPPMLKMYNDLVPPENTEFFRAGPRAALNLDDATTVQRTLNGNMVYLSRMIDGTTEFGQRNLLAQTVEIGSYNTMVDIYKDNGSKYFEEEYESNHRSIRVYNEDVDEDNIINMEFVIENCHVFDERSGLPFLPKNSRLYSSNPSDRQMDMLSYNDDDNPSVRKSATLFGHISENHFSTNSIVNLCRTVAKHHSKGGKMNVQEMEEILNDGLLLVNKINSAPITRTWFFNVMFEHWRKHGVLGTENMTNNGEYKAYVKKITKVAKRSVSNTMRVLKGLATNGLSLPEYDYWAARKAILAGGENGNKTVAQVVTQAETDKKLGGSCDGALAGFGSWDGLLMLQAELGSGSSTSSNFTKNGYLISDCKVADRFVNLIKQLTGTFNFLFDNAVFMNKSKASSLIEDPTPEHVLAEWLLGLTGIPVYLDVSKLTSLKGAANARSTLRTTHDANLNDAIINHVKDKDKQNMATFFSIKRWVVERVTPKDQAGGASIEKKLKFFFLPVTAPAFRAANEGRPNNSYGTTDYNTGANSIVGDFIRTIFPLSNLTAQLLTHKSFDLRSVTLELLNRYVITNAKINDATKKDLLIDFLTYLGKATRLDTRIELIPDVDNLIQGVNNLTAADDVTRINALPTGNAGVVWFDKTDFAPVNFTMIADWFARQQKNFKVGKIDSVLQEKYRSYSDAENRDDEIFEEKKQDSTPLNKAPVLYMMNIPSTQDPTEEDARKGTNVFSQGGQGGGLFIGAQYDDPLQEEQFFEAGAGLVVYDGERFFRTPLVLSAKQALQAEEILKADRALDSVMNIRLADPTNIDRYVDSSQIKSLLKKIRLINEKAQNEYLAPGMSDTTSFASAYESPLLFFPENVHLKERALALTAFGKGRQESFLESGASRRPLNSNRSRREKSKSNTMGRREDARGGKRQRTSYGLRVLSSRDDRDLGGDSDDEEYEGGGRGMFDAPSDDDDEYGGLGGGQQQPDLGAANLGLLRRQMGGGEDNEDINSNILTTFVKLGEATNSKLLTLIAKVYLTSYLNKRTLLRFYKHSILIPFGALLFRPHMRYESNRGIKTLAGESTGVTLVGHTGLALQNDVATKTHIGHFTLYDSSVVIRNKQVFVQPNVFISRCLGGAGFSPINPRYYNTRTGETGGGCVIVVLVPYEEVDFHNYLDVTGRFEEAASSNFVDGNRLARPGYSQCWRANQIWRFKGEDQIGADDVGHDDQSASRRENTKVIRAQQFNYSTATKTYTSKISNKGHWGDEGPGSKIARNGGLRSLVQHPTVQIM